LKSRTWNGLRLRRFDGALAVKVSALWLVCVLLGGCEETLPARDGSGLPGAAGTADVRPGPVATEDASLPMYLPQASIAGQLTSAGSDTLANLMTLWAEAFQARYPGVAMQVQAAGSSTAPPALSEGAVDLGPMSRRMKDNEVEAFRRRHGYAPLPVRVAIDALAIYVHKDNPLAALSLQDIDAIYSNTRRCGRAKPVRYWGDLGLAGSWHRRPIQRFGRNSVSGTYGYFKSVALCGGDVRDRVNEQPGSASVVQGVASALNGIGYSGIGFQTSGVRALPLAALPGSRPVLATRETVANGDYPLARPLYIYLNKAPGKALSPLTLEFMRFVLSREGQAVVARDGFVSLPGARARRERARLES
jgi:phosphate transport system substrate-binding protein